MDDKGGQPERWSDDLWKAYVDEFKEADQSHVESCNRFLDAISGQKRSRFPMPPKRVLTTLLKIEPNR